VNTTENIARSMCGAREKVKLFSKSGHDLTLDHQAFYN